MLVAYVAIQFILQFIGEAALDERGPKRVCWCLLGNDIKAAMCAGDYDHLSLDHDIIGLQVCV